MTNLAFSRCPKFARSGPVSTDGGAPPGLRLARVQTARARPQLFWRRAPPMDAPPPRMPVPVQHGSVHFRDLASSPARKRTRSAPAACVLQRPWPHLKCDAEREGRDAYAWQHPQKQAAHGAAHALGGRVTAEAAMQCAVSCSPQRIPCLPRARARMGGLSATETQRVASEALHRSEPDVRTVWFIHANSRPPPQVAQCAASSLNLNACCSGHGRKSNPMRRAARSVWAGSAQRGHTGTR